MLPVSRTEYASYPKKDAAGHPDRVLDGPPASRRTSGIHIWPVPYRDGYDPELLLSAAGAGRRFHQRSSSPRFRRNGFMPSPPALAAKLAMSWAPDRLAFLAPAAEKAYDTASRSWRRDRAAIHQPADQRLFQELRSEPWAMRASSAERGSTPATRRRLRFATVAASSSIMSISTGRFDYAGASLINKRILVCYLLPRYATAAASRHRPPRRSDADHQPAAAGLQSGGSELARDERPLRPRSRDWAYGPARHRHSRGDGAHPPNWRPPHRSADGRTGAGHQ